MVAATAVAVATVSAAGVFAFGGARAGTITDRTIACRLTSTLDSASFRIGANVKEPPAYAGGGVVSQPGELWIGTDALLYAGASKQLIPTSGGKPIKAGYYFDESTCASARPIALAASALPSLGVFSRAGNTQLAQTCSVAPNSILTIRLHVVLSAPGTPASAQLIVRGGKHPHPIAFVSWTPTRFRAFVSAACQQS